MQFIQKKDIAVSLHFITAAKQYTKKRENCSVDQININQRNKVRPDDI
jgi:hypothetical protein